MLRGSDANVDRHPEDATCLVSIKHPGKYAGDIGEFTLALMAMVLFLQKPGRSQKA